MLLSPTHAADEHAWRLLFDIALGHGVWLRTQRLTYDGLLCFLRSADLLGPHTGVYAVLLESVWQQHCMPASTHDNNSNNNDDVAGAACDAHALRRAAVYARGVVGLEGFTDIMNVVCVRCYQTYLCAQLRAAATTAATTNYTDATTTTSSEEGVVLSLREALARSAEAHVRLRDSVAYTAQAHLRDFVARCVVRRHAAVCLDHRVNAWPAHVQQLVRHVVGSLEHRVVCALYARYTSPRCGRMTFAQYTRFVHDVFADFSAAQEVSALAIFGCDRFAARSAALQQQLTQLPKRLFAQQQRRQQQQQQTLRMRVASPPPPSSLRDDDAVGAVADDAAPLSTSTLRALSSQLRATAQMVAETIGLDDFVDALLMLGVVAYANEAAWPRHRALTAKTWSVFDDYLCPAAAAASAAAAAVTGTRCAAVTMADELLLAPCVADVQPCIGFVHPRRVHVERAPFVVLGGLELRVRATTDRDVPSNNNNNNNSDNNDNNNSDSNHARTCCGSAVAVCAARLFDDALDAPVVDAGHDDAAATTTTRTTDERSGDGNNACCVYADDAVCASWPCDAHHLCVQLPPSVCDTSTYTARIRLRYHTTSSHDDDDDDDDDDDEDDDDDDDDDDVRTPDGEAASAVVVSFVPLRRVCLTLRDATTHVVYTSADVVVHGNTITHRIAASTLQALRRAYDAHATCDRAPSPSSSHTDVNKDEQPPQQRRRLDADGFVAACVQLTLVADACAAQRCRAVLAHYAEVRRTLQRARVAATTTTATAMTTTQSRVDAATAATHDAAAHATTLSLHDFVRVVLLLCARQASVPVSSAGTLYYLHTALACGEAAHAASLSSLRTRGTTATTAAAAASSTTMPYDALLDVPVNDVVARRQRNAREAAQRRDALLAQLRSDVAAQLQRKRAAAANNNNDDGSISSTLCAHACRPLPHLPRGAAGYDGGSVVLSPYGSDECAGRVAQLRCALATLSHDFWSRELVIGDDATAGLEL